MTFEVAHLAGAPVEETVSWLLPVGSLAVAFAAAWCRAKWDGARSGAGRCPDGAAAQTEPGR
jgi:hypothetical protein